MPELSPYQFDNEQRAKALSVKAFVDSYGDHMVPNPLRAHLPAPVREDHGDGSFTMRSQPGDLPPSYERGALYQSPSRVEPVPTNRLESSQPYISRTHVHNMLRRKGEAPPIEVVHHVDEDRYAITEGNHRAMAAIRRGEEHVPALVTRVTRREKDML